LRELEVGHFRVAKHKEHEESGQQSVLFVLFESLLKSSYLIPIAAANRLPLVAVHPFTERKQD
jgi:hypothetical protein